MPDAPDPSLALMFAFFEGFARKGPGSEASTRKALSMLDGLPARPRIVDFGCGSGVASLVLARATGGDITAVDIHRPFLSQLEAAAADEGLADRIRTVVADMSDPPFPDRAFDLVWSEAAVYIMGFEQSLKRWRRLLRPGGFLAVSEVCWLDDAPPREAVDFWNAEYPAMTGMEANLATVRSVGYEPLGHFALPPADWEAYYGPLQEKLAVFRQEQSESPDARAFVDSMQQEIDIRRAHGDSYGYVFYLARAT